MGIMLGNLSIEEMQRRAGVQFPAELVDFMRDKHQAEAANIETGKWHCFDIPFNLVCGDMDTAKEVFKHLSPLSSKFKQSMSISLQPAVASAE